jgi:MoxR-like ATPase
MHTEETDRDVELLGQLASARDRLIEQIGQRIVGQHDVVRGVLTAIVSGGHALLMGVPGLGKTLLVSTIADALDLKFSRIQFTPDLMPSDITGTEIIEEDPTTGKREFRFVHGPIFANVILADEINRTPPKTQAALLQAMQEHEVTAAGQTYMLTAPFFVLATQNPIEQEGTYPLPEAQLDRFMLEIAIGYPERDDEERIVEETTGDKTHPVDVVLSSSELLEIQHLVRRIPAPKPVVRAAVTLARLTRPDREYVSWGAGPRASQYLVLGAKAQAALDGRPMADIDDVQSVALAVLRHRVVVNFAAEAAGRSAEDICSELIERSQWASASHTA